MLAIPDNSLIPVQNENMSEDEQSKELTLSFDEYNQALTEILSNPILARFVRTLLPIPKRTELKRLSPSQINLLLKNNKVKLDVPQFNTGASHINEHLRIETARIILIQFIAKNPWFKINQNSPYEGIKAAFYQLTQLLKFNGYDAETDAFRITDKGEVEYIEPK